MPQDPDSLIPDESRFRKIEAIEQIRSSDVDAIKDPFIRARVKWEAAIEELRAAEREIERAEKRMAAAQKRWREDQQEYAKALKDEAAKVGQ